MRKITWNPGGTPVVIGKGSVYGITSLTGLGAATLVPQEKRAPYQDGSTLIDQLYDPRDIVLTGVIGVGNNFPQIYAYRQALAHGINGKLGAQDIIYQNDNGSWAIKGLPIGPIFDNKNVTDGNQKFQVTFHCPDPYWRAPNTKQSILSGTGYLTVSNLGDVPCPAEFIITGPITNPKILNTTTGQYIRLALTLTAGQYVIITTFFGAKTISVYSAGTPLIVFDNYSIPITGSALSALVTMNGMQYLDLSSTMFSLACGSNVLQLIDEGTNSGMSLTVIYAEQFTGV